MNATRSRLADGRWHFQHGPIDLIIGADGEPAAVTRAIEHAWRRFGAILRELVGELGRLRLPVSAGCAPDGPVARRMFDACLPHRPAFITPMAAVAGAVADELIPYFSAEDGIARAYVNNGGDIALHLRAARSYRIGLFADLAKFDGKVAELDGDFEISAELPVRGLATSGWRGRSFSLGIADSVTVLAADASTADAAATMIANAVDCEHRAIVRAPASSLKDDSDLGDLPVTIEVGPLPSPVIDAALERGARHAQSLIGRAAIFGALLTLQGRARAEGMRHAGQRRLQAA